MEIKFSKLEKDAFYKALSSKVNEHLKQGKKLDNARTLLWFKLVFYAMLFSGSFVLLYTSNYSSLSGLILNYILLGITGMLLAFNSAHDACHGTFSRKKWVNEFIFHTSFNLQGVNAYLWQMRHISSHHIFPNVDGCDADIDENPFIKLSPSTTLKSYHKYQHLYAPIVYSIYTLHWIFYKDLRYLMMDELANLKEISHPKKRVVAFFLWKLLYFALIIAMPIFLGYPISWVLIAFLVMSVFNSNFFLHSLISTHFAMETVFPVSNNEGRLPFNYARHQLSTALDYHPTSKVANFIYGGFNAHAAHHLFPHLPHTTYAELSAIIEDTCQEFGYPYNKQSYFGAVASHFKFLKKIGSAEPSLQLKSS